VAFARKNHRWTQMNTDPEGLTHLIGLAGGDCMWQLEDRRKRG
jgi:hypothetical protein